MKLLVSIILLLCLSSCSYLIDEQYRKDEQGNYTSPYMGKWIGNFSGEINGTLILNVSKSGNIEIIKTLNDGTKEVYYANLLGGGSGALNPSSSPNSGFTLYGSLETKSGTWKQQNWNGNWSVTKQ